MGTTRRDSKSMSMKIFCAWLGIIGGVLWAFKSAYDWLGLGRVIHTGYPPSDPTDYVAFLCPLLCIGSVLAIALHDRLRFGISPMLLAAGLLLNGAYFYSETYQLRLGFPAGFVFLTGGSLLSLVGLSMLVNRLWRSNAAPRSLQGVAAALLMLTVLFFLSPFFTESLQAEAATAITVVLASLIGLCWAGIGATTIMLRPEAQALIEPASH
jgi:hypothetical protein